MLYGRTCNKYKATDGMGNKMKGRRFLPHIGSASLGWDIITYPLISVDKETIRPPHTWIQGKQPTQEPTVQP